MKVIVELEFTEREARVLRSWASYGRHCDNIKRLMEAADYPTSDQEDDAMNAVEDIDSLKQPIDSMHRQVRQKLIEAGVKSLWRDE